MFSRREPDRADRDVCIAFLPAEGGRLSRVVCPTIHPDSNLDAWLQPTVSPNGERIAYVRESGPFRIAPPLAPLTRELVVAPAAAPESVTALLGTSYVLPDGRRATALRQLAWRDDATLRFLAATDTVRGTGVRGVLDTVFAGLAVVDLTVPAGGMTVVAGPTAPRLFADAPDGGLWFVEQDDRDSLRYVAPDGTPGPGVGLPGAAIDLTRVGNNPFVLTEGSVGTIVRIDVAGGQSIEVPMTGAPRAIAGFAEGERLLVELRSTSSPATDLWLWQPE